MLAQEGQVRPGVARVPEQAEEVQHRRVRVLVHRLGEARPERRVGEVVGGAHAVHERQVGLVQIAGPPRQQRGVQRDDQHREAGRPRPGEETPRHLAVLAPVELEPPLGVPHRLRDLLHRRARRRRQHERHALRGGGPGGGGLGVRVHDRQHADGGEGEGCRQGPPEHLGGEVALVHVPQHARHDPAPGQGRPVGAGRAAVARAARHVAHRSRAEPVFGQFLQPGQIGGEPGHGPGHPVQVDLVLEVRPVPCHPSTPARRRPRAPPTIPTGTWDGAPRDHLSRPRPPAPERGRRRRLPGR